jgi:hypothetical protein
MESATRSAEDAEVRGVENESNDRPPTTLPWLSYTANAALAEKQLAVEAAAAAEKAMVAAAEKTMVAAAEKTKVAAQPPHLGGRFGPLLLDPDTDAAEVRGVVFSSTPREVKRAAKAAPLRVSPALSHCPGPTLAHQCSPPCSVTGAQGGEGSCQEAAGSPRRPGESPRPGAAESGGQG